MPARGVLVGEVLRQRDLVDRLVRIVFHQLFDAGPGRFPTIGGACQRLVILKPQTAAGNLGAEHGLVGIDRFCVVSLPRQGTRLGQFVLSNTRLANGVFQFADFRALRRTFPEAIQIHLRGRSMATDGLDIAHTGQSDHVVRRRPQQLQPVFARQVVAVLAFPITGLGDELVETGRIGRGARGGCGRSGRCLWRHGHDNGGQRDV